MRQLLADMLSEEGSHAEAARTLVRINTSAAGRCVGMQQRGVRACLPTPHARGPPRVHVAAGRSLRQRRRSISSKSQSCSWRCVCTLPRRRGRDQQASLTDCGWGVPPVLLPQEDLTVEAQDYIKKASEVVHHIDNAHVKLRFRVRPRRSRAGASIATVLTSVPGPWRVLPSGVVRSHPGLAEEVLGSVTQVLPAVPDAG